MAKVVQKQNGNWNEHEYGQSYGKADTAIGQQTTFSIIIDKKKIYIYIYTITVAATTVLLWLDRKVDVSAPWTEHNE